MNTHHAPEFGGAPIIDAETMDSLAALASETDPELVAELIDIFLQDAGERVELMRQERDAGRIESVARAAHALKSASANVGALVFSSKCREIEAAARQGEPVDRAVTEALGMFQEVCGALASLRAEQR